MSDAATPHFAELEELTGWDRPRWERFLTMPADIQALEIQNVRDEDWASPGASTFDRVLAILDLIGTIAGVVGGVAGAAGAIKALKG